MFIDYVISVIKDYWFSVKEILNKIVEECDRCYIPNRGESEDSLKDISIEQIIVSTEEDRQKLLNVLHHIRNSLTNRSCLGLKDVLNICLIPDLIKVKNDPVC